MPEELRPALGRLDWVGPAVTPDELPRFEIANHGGGRTEMLGLFWGAEGRLQPEQAPRGRFDWVYCVPFADPGLQLAFVRSYKARGARVACGTYAPLAAAHTALVREVASLADAFFCNETEACTLFGSVEAAVVPAGRLLFVTRGAAGARVVQGAFATEIPGLPAHELDPTGAGDTFCGTVLARLGAGAHPVEAARHGIAHAAVSVGEVGPAALLREGTAPEPPWDDRTRIDGGRLAALASLLASRDDVRPFDFTGENFPPVGHPSALDFFFAATLQQFGFWRLEDGRYAGPMVASLGGRVLKGSDYLWAAYRRWMLVAPKGLRPEAQSALRHDDFARHLRGDDGSLPLPDPDRFLDAARAYGADMVALGLTPPAVALWATFRGDVSAPGAVAALLRQLDHVGGYKEDPLRKKSALVALILRERPERFLPAEDSDVPPIVDYHVQRSLLRLGVVEVVDDALRARLVARERLETDEEWAVRRAAFRAMERLRAESGRSMAACDYFLFQMRHRCPEMSEPECPRCPADGVCAHRKELFQPVRLTTFY
jgi:hypothetical protein